LFSNSHMIKHTLNYILTRASVKSLFDLLRRRSYNLFSTLEQHRLA
jgi:hypothetical protein